MSTNQEGLKATIKEVLMELFPDAPIEDVFPNPMVDDDGDPILRIFVVLGNTKEKLDPKARLGLIRKLRTRLAEIGHDEFPVVSFYSSDEARKLRFETA